MRIKIPALLFAVLLLGGGRSGHAQEEPRLEARDDLVLFDGKGLDGWVTVGGRYDGRARWSVEDGCIVGRQGEGKAGGLLYTARPHRNFIFSVEARIDWLMDSGIFLRMSPEGRGAQVTLDWRPGGEIGAIYSDGFLAHNEKARERFRKDDWNRVTVRCDGPDMHLQVWLNGERITDYTLPQGSEGFAPTGLIGLQVHGGAEVDDAVAARFRNPRLRDLPDHDPALFACDDSGLLVLTDAGRKAGWTPLFDGKSLEGWEAPPGGAVVEDGLILFPKKGGEGELQTREDFRDFELRLEFRIRYMCNSGVFLRASRDGENPAYSGCEIQILDDFNWEKVTGSKLKDYQFTGGLYGSVANPHRDALRPLGQWNLYEIRYVGDRIAVRLNGVELYDVDTLEVPGKPFKERAQKGFIGLQRHAPGEVAEGDYAAFRNLFIRKLD